MGRCNICGFPCYLYLHVCSILSFTISCVESLRPVLSSLSFLVFVGWLKLLFQQLAWEEPVSITLFCCCSVAQSCLTLRNPVGCSPPGSSVWWWTEFLRTCMFKVCPKLPRVVEYLILDLHLLFLTMFSCSPAPGRDMWDHFVFSLCKLPGCAKILPLYSNNFTRMCLVNYPDRHTMGRLVWRFRKLFLNCLLK